MPGEIYHRHFWSLLLCPLLFVWGLWNVVNSLCLLTSDLGQGTGEDEVTGLCLICPHLCRRSWSEQQWTTHITHCGCYWLWPMPTRTRRSWCRVSPLNEGASWRQERTPVWKQRFVHFQVLYLGFPPHCLPFGPPPPQAPFCVNFSSLVLMHVPSDERRCGNWRLICSNPASTS